MGTDFAFVINIEYLCVLLNSFFYFYLFLRVRRLDILRARLTDCGIMIMCICRNWRKNNLQHPRLSEALCFLVFIFHSVISVGD